MITRSTARTRIARLAAASVLALGLGALGAGSASASYNSWAGSAPPESSVASRNDSQVPTGGTWDGGTCMGPCAR